MKPPSAWFSIGRMHPPIRRVLAIDAGSRNLRLLLVQSDFGRLRLLKQDLVDLHEEGLVSAEETQVQLRAVLEQWGGPPLALVLPQHLSTSQVIDLPLVPEAEVQKLIHDESVKLSGVSDSRIVYDFVRSEAPSKNHQQFWVTLCQENEIRERLSRLDVAEEDLCEVTTTANALISAYRVQRPGSTRAILVHQGAQTTVLAILLDGHAAFAASFPMGGDFFTRALARLGNSSEETAESFKRQHNLFAGPDAFPEFISVVEGWVAELKRQLNEWFAEKPGMAQQASTFELIASGGGMELPGLLAYLQGEAGLALKPWPTSAEDDLVTPAKGFEVAYGTALQALGLSPLSVSLVPEDYQLAWKKRVTRQRIEFASAVLSVLCILILSLGTWHQIRLINRKEALSKKVKAGVQAVEANTAFMAELTDEYDLLRPVFAAQQNTLDTLKTYALLQNARSNRSFWYVAVADQPSYFSLPPAALSSTNRSGKTNVTAAPLERPSTAAAVTNLAIAKPGCIAELCVPEQPETARAMLSQLVTELRQQSLFAKVDLLSEDLRRNISDPKVLLAEQHYVVALDFAVTDFQQPLQSKRQAGRDSRAAPKRPPRPSLVPNEANGDRTSSGP